MTVCLIRRGKNMVKWGRQPERAFSMEEKMDTIKWYLVWFVVYTIEGLFVIRGFGLYEYPIVSIMGWFLLVLRDYDRKLKLWRMLF